MSTDYGDLGDLEDLYQQTIVDHSRSPRNCRRLDDATGTCEGFNPFCGDRVKVFVRMEGDTLADVTFTGRGCAICTASASMMTEALKSRSRAGAEELFERFHTMLTADNGSDAEALDKLVVFEGVRRFPIRVKCATLPWHSMRSAMTGDGSDKFSTE
jgi:nitrogen fixation NifU-like protein